MAYTNTDKEWQEIEEKLKNAFQKMVEEFNSPKAIEVKRLSKILGLTSAELCGQNLMDIYHSHPLTNHQQVNILRIIEYIRILEQGWENSKVLLTLMFEGISEPTT